MVAVNYNAAEKVLHALALSNLLVPEATYALEKQLAGRKGKISSRRHVFISGMARSGTTILLDRLYASGEFASLTYADMPFVLCPNLWKPFTRRKTKSSLKARERAHGDGLSVSPYSPEAFEEVYWQTLGGDREVREFCTYTDLVCQRYGRERYLSKNNQNIKRLMSLASVFPRGRFLIPFREPLQHAASLMRQHRRFLKADKADAFVGKYMRWIGHREFGPAYTPAAPGGMDYPDPGRINHWLEQWRRVYSGLFHDLTEEAPGHTRLVCYEDLCSDKALWPALCRWVDLDVSPEALFRQSKSPVNGEYNPALLSTCKDLYATMKQSDLCRLGKSRQFV